MMILGATISIITTVHLNLPDIISDNQLQFTVVVLSLITSFLAGMITFLNPQQKWQQLRGAALAIESEIWKFRTRTGTYTTKQITNAGSFSNEAEEKLKTFLEDMKSHVLKSASILETAMFASMEMFDYPESAQKYNHGKFLCAEPVSGL